MREYTVDYFIDKFKAIPKNKWTTESFLEGSKCCALGHCGMRDNEHSESDTEESKGLCRVVNESKIMPKLRIVDINDGADHRYPQYHPKDRILAMLQDIKNESNKS